MKNKVISIAIMGLLAFGFNGCTKEEETAGGSGGGDTDPKTIVITQNTNATKIIIQWRRAIKQGYYTQLELSNTKKLDKKIASTNNSGAVTITCNKTVDTSSGTEYECRADNVDYPTTITLTDTGSNDFTERAGVRTDSLTNPIAKMYHKYQGDTTFTVDYKYTGHK